MAAALARSANQPRPDVTLFTTVGLEFEVVVVAQEQAEHLVERFKGRGPLYGSVAVATPDIRIWVRTRG